MFHITEDSGGVPQDRQEIIKGLRAFNYSNMPEHLRDRGGEINLYVRDDEGTIRGGLLASFHWDFIEVHILWLDEAVRGERYGTKLINVIEAKARELNCVLIKLDTLSFQALDFYKKNGFTVFGQIDDVAGGNTHYYLQKRL
ncbi:GNAT family N-acetyltransferase [Paenibacillus sp. N1-5-1-14]|uniref:GNAT family N-acetyltransferase n=1 Tax=Paenibacillus radicibacter TaxID=2972488 RepID=UPI002158E7D3|nr:GNAT family N-acetyltransferase [Paenibacillus radicibacter]MCR8643612.1 GNAT family N-acetyltransferase [Paenibacillus radicibacter]